MGCTPPSHGRTINKGPVTVAIAHHHPVGTLNISMSEAPTLVVGIGASAGGLAAFKTFLRHTPSDTGMAFVLVQHLDPHHKSLLVELLGAQSPIPVVAATNGVTIKPNCVFVIPPDATLTIKGDVLHVATPAPAREHRRPIDTFFRSLAEDWGERAVGIVLAGVGSDGTNGIKIIKELGGLTLAQAEHDATAMQGMPSSAVATGLVDHVVPVEAMAAQLIEYLKHITAVADKKDGDGYRKDLQEHLASITSLLHRRSEHDFSGYKETTVLRRIQRRMQVLQIDDAPDYIERLKTDQGEVEALFGELLIGVTQFFRDPEAFKALKISAVVPLLAIKDKGEPIRVWVPGCSTGEEVYSVAILLREVLQELNDSRAVMIFGTDIDANAVAIARAGRYSKEASGLSPEHFDKWFVRDGAEYCPIADIREMCVFSTHSLVKDPPFSRLDLISCRNVLIYLDEELQDRLMRIFHYALLPGGNLFLGSAESVTRHSKLFTAIDKKYRILQRRDAGATLPYFQPQGAPTLRSPGPILRRQGEDRIDKAIGRVMQQYVPAYFVIDRNLEISRFSGAETGAYLEPSEGAASFNLFNILRKALRPAVRAAVNQALANGQHVINDNLAIRIDGKPRHLTLIVEPIGGADGAKTPGGCVVAFRDTSPPGATAPADAPTIASDAHVQALEMELHATKAQLEAATDELEERIQDMRTTTEEFQAVNEELQSANEELETAKEEMQSVNEELQTINSELNNKNELLTRLNTDMQNLLDSTQIATVFLDDALRIRHFTPALTQLFPVRETDRGRPIIQIVTGLDYTTIQDDVNAVQRDGSVVERDLALRSGEQVFVMRIRPYRTPRNIAGVVITFVDITERKKAELALAERNIQLSLAGKAALVGSYAYDTDTEIMQISEGYAAIHGFPEGTVEVARSEMLATVHPDDIGQITQLRSEAFDQRRREYSVEFRIIRAGGEVRWVETRGFISYDGEERPHRVVGVSIDVTERKRVEEQQRMLVAELDHRVKNVLAIVQAIAAHTMDASSSMHHFVAALDGRIRSLASTHEILSDRGWLGIPLEELVQRELAPYATGSNAEVGGPEVMLGAEAGQVMGMVFHELATNAAKYGALSAPSGRLSISWRLSLNGSASDRLVFEWRETGGPMVGSPSKSSYGMNVVRELIPYELGGTVDYVPSPEGVQCQMDIPLNRLSGGSLHNNLHPLLPSNDIGKTRGG
jgi:two-component system CheB/CheR fusion protein